MCKNNENINIRGEGFWGLFLGIVLCVFLVACGGGGGGGDAGPGMSPGGGGAGSSTPSFGSSMIDAPSYEAGTTITALMLPAADGGNGVLTYSINPMSPFGLMFDPSTRRLSGTPSGSGLAAGRNSITVTYTATDADGETDTLMFEITVEVTDPMPTFGSEMIGDLTYIEGETISTETLPVATGGDGTLTYSINPMSPFGLTFNPSTRQLSGTPTSEGGPTTVTYTATDADGDPISLTFRITVAADEQPSFASAAMIDDKNNYLQNSAISPEILPEATGGNGALTYSINPERPFGLMFNPSTRRLSGTPTSSGPAMTVTYTATDEDGDPVSLMFTIDVAVGSRPSFGDLTIPDQEYVEADNAVSAIRVWFLPQATGGDGDLTYSLAPTDDPEGSLPQGLVFNSNTRRFSGSPADTMTARNEDVHTDMTYTVTDDDGDTATLEFRITLTDVERWPSFRYLPEIANDGSDNVLETFNRVFTQNVEITPITLPEAQSGNPPIIYSYSPVIQGLTLDRDTRVLSGTPPFPTREFGSSAIVPREVTYRALDANNQFYEVTFTITVNEQP